MFNWIDRSKNLLGYTFTPDADMVRLAEEVWMAQDGCNGCGLGQGYARALKAINSHPQNKIGTDFTNQNPITKCWLDKLCDLAGMSRDSGTAMVQVMDMKDGKEITVEITVRGTGHWDEVIAKQS